MKSKRGFNLREEDVRSWKYLKESKNFIYVSIGIFFLFFLLAFFIYPPEIFLEYLREFIKELLEKTQSMSFSEITSFIFFNNLKSSFFGIILGVFLGIFPILALMANGYVLGFVSFLSVAEEGILSLWRILPHGIFELPAIFISFGLGLKFGSFIFQKNKSESFRNFLLNSLRVFLFIVVPLLIIAAIIEGFFISFI
jgi:stage II sporulation protein M